MGEMPTFAIIPTADCYTEVCLSYVLKNCIPSDRRKSGLRGILYYRNNATPHTTAKTLLLVFRVQLVYTVQILPPTVSVPYG